MDSIDYFNGLNPVSFPLLTIATQQQQLKNVPPPIANKTANAATIPFVQIHTNPNPDVGQRRNFGNVFRRASNHEIKSEPIKSESSSDAIKERVNATPTPPVAVGIRVDSISTPPNNQNNGSTENGQSTADIVNPVQVTNPDNGHTVLIPILHTCNHCPFMSLREASLTDHVRTMHSDDLFCNGDGGFHNRIQCPGCDNVFYAHKSMHAHLREDHRMTLDDAKLLMDAVNGIFAPTEKLATQNESISIAGHCTQRKSRIYLKNVDCLLREPIEHQENYYQMNTFDNNCNSMVNDEVDPNDFMQMLDVAANKTTISFSNDTEIVNNNPPRPAKQKISIKSVDVLLREPRRDYELQTFSNFMNACNDLDLHALNSSDPFNYTAVKSNALCEKDEENSPNNLENCEKPRPKIYIKNVDILKEPIILSGSVSNTQEPNSSSYSFISQSLAQGGSYLNSANLSDPAQIFDADLAPLPMNTISEQYVFENANNSSAAQDFAFVTDANKNSYILDNARFSNVLDYGLDSTNSTSMPIFIETTPSPQPSAVDSVPITVEIPLETPQTPPQTQKIFIKNVDILKQTHFQEHRGTLHLRTVDELNLMNKNEVENLIAPNLDNTSYIGHNGAVSIEHFHNPKLAEDDALYENNNFKLQDFDPQVVAKNWADDYDLGDDLDCIITETDAPVSAAQPSQKPVHDLETPQMTLISIRDIEELTGSGFQQMNSIFANPDMDGASFGALRPIEAEPIISDAASCEAGESTTQEDSSNSINTSTSDRKQREVAPEVVPEVEDTSKPNQSNDTTATKAIAEKPVASDVSLTTYPLSLSSGNFKDIPPPLAPVTSSTIAQFVPPSAVPTTEATAVNTVNTSTIPPLVPVPSLIQLSASKNYAISSTMPSALSTAPTERGRIYVANNLMREHPIPPDKAGELKSSVAVSGGGGTSIRGRPFGSNRTGITKMRKLYGNGAEIELGIKCTVIPGCAFRFKKTETLEYHLRCHNSSNSSSMQCPECKSTEFTNWNTLHTHLWRSHKVDMELYSCQLCTFKTPVYSRLENTHSKIHFEDRNYKCDQCDKAFKNTKQLKNHRRWHRNHNEGNNNNSALNQKAQLECKVCGRIVSSKSSLNLHMLTHETTAKRFKCRNCDYMANDHNAFRRHKMMHENIKMYICPYCCYQSIQSVSYQKHIQQNHPDQADSHIHKCSFCSFSTINRALFAVHQAKHEPPKVLQHEGRSSSVENTRAENELVSRVNNVQTAPPRTKIKVKSDLLLTNPLKF